MPPGKPKNPFLMRVCGSERASEQGFPGVGIIAPEQPISLVNSLVKTQSAADGRLFSFAGKENGMKKTLQFRRERACVMGGFGGGLCGQG